MVAALSRFDCCSAPLGVPRTSSRGPVESILGHTVAPGRIARESVTPRSAQWPRSKALPEWSTSSMRHAVNGSRGRACPTSRRARPRHRRRGRSVRDRPGRATPARLRLRAVHDPDRLLARRPHRRGGRDAARAARLLSELGRDAPRGARADRPHPRARAGRPDAPLPHLGRLGGGRVGLEARASAPPGQGPARAAQDHRPPGRLSRLLARSALADGDPGCARPLRAPARRCAPRREHRRPQLLDLSRDRQRLHPRARRRSSSRSSPRAPTASRW